MWAGGRRSSVEGAQIVRWGPERQPSCKPCRLSAPIRPKALAIRLRRARAQWHETSHAVCACCQLTCHEPSVQLLVQQWGVLLGSPQLVLKVRKEADTAPTAGPISAHLPTGGGVRRCHACQGARDTSPCVGEVWQTTHTLEQHSS